MRNRALRRQFRETKKMRRLKEDMNQHRADGYLQARHVTQWWIDGGWPVNTIFHCPCFFDKRAQGMFANGGRGGQTQNPRRHPMQKGERLTMQERRSLDSFKSQLIP